MPVLYRTIPGIDDHELTLSVNLVKRPGVSETAFPDFVDDLFGLRPVFAEGSRLDRQNGSSADALLMLLCELPLPASEELARPSAFSAQRTRTNLHVLALSGT